MNTLLWMDSGTIDGHFHAYTYRRNIMCGVAWILVCVCTGPPATTSNQSNMKIARINSSYMNKHTRRHAQSSHTPQPSAPIYFHAIVHKLKMAINGFLLTSQAYSFVTHTHTHSTSHDVFAWLSSERAAFISISAYAAHDTLCVTLYVQYRKSTRTYKSTSNCRLADGCCRCLRAVLPTSAIGPMNHSSNQLAWRRK